MYACEAYLEHHDLQYQAIVGLRRLGAQIARGSPHAAGIWARTSRWKSAVAAAGIERFEASGQRDADHGGGRALWTGAVTVVLKVLDVAS